MIEPIKPVDLENSKFNHIPGIVIEIVNNLISEEWNGRSATIKQRDIVDRIVKITPKFVNDPESEIYDKGWLNFEDLYGSYGWVVTYDKPAYCESYPATFKFERA